MVEEENPARNESERPMADATDNGGVVPKNHEGTASAATGGGGRPNVRGPEARRIGT